MNYMEQIAKMLGVEIGEEFDLYDGEDLKEYSPYHFTNEGFVDFESDESYTILCGVLKGEYIIKKKPWKPKKGDDYWCCIRSKGAETSVVRHKWNDNLQDIIFFGIGNCFKTQKEAETKGKEIIEQIKKEYEEA